MKFWFTADTHIGHGNIMKYCARTAFMTPEEQALLAACPKNEFGGYRRDDVAHIEICKESRQRMNQAIIDNHNAVVGPQDLVYHLGDVAFDDVEQYLSQINGRLVIVLGNHDKPLVDYLNRCPDYIRRKYIILPPETTVRCNDQAIVISHYAMRVWDKSHYGSWQLYGHTHGTLPDDPNLLQMDVGVDCNGFTPVSFEQVKDFMSKKTFKPMT